MALTTKCPKCDSSSFEINSNTKVRNCGHKIHFIQCASCGAAISTFSERQDYVIEQIGKKVGVR